MAHINSHALAPAMGAKLSHDAEKDFVPISMVGVTPNIPISATPTSQDRQGPGRTVPQEPGKISFALAGAARPSTLR